MQIVQSLYIEKNCSGAFIDGKLYKEPTKEFLENFKFAWKHTPELDEEKYKYVYLMQKSEDLSAFSDSPELFDISCKKIKSHQKAAITAKVDLSEQCFFDLLPEHHLEKWLLLRESAMKNIVKVSNNQQDYDILHKIHVLVSNIAQQDINFDNKSGRVVYNIFGSATGRLTTKKGSVPVLTLKKEQRELLKPQNDAFVELDLNAAEVRMLMALSGREQPQGDIHEWIVSNVFSGQIERSQAKVELFAWLYNPSNSKSRFDQIFSRQIFRDFYFSEDEVLTTPFGRKLVVEERKAQNYLLQSTTSDQVLENAYKIQKLLEEKKSMIAFTLHDSIILDMHREDAIMLRDIKKQFEQTRWGSFVSTCKIGKNFSDLKELKI